MPPTAPSPSSERAILSVQELDQITLLSRPRSFFFRVTSVADALYLRLTRTRGEAAARERLDPPLSEPPSRETARQRKRSLLKADKTVANQVK